MSERLRFIHRLQDGERMTDLCREFGISRKTGYKVLKRFERLGSAGLQDDSRAPVRSPHKTSAEVVDAILALKKKYPSWGAKKLVAELPRRQAGIHVPARSTVGLILKSHGLVAPRRVRRNAPAYTGGLQHAQAPNDVWCTDFKGQFLLNNGAQCYPLTITDQYSRYILGCEALESTSGGPAREVFEHVFEQYGLPAVIRTDNGPPFASRGLGALSALSVWWLKLGILPERIEPGHPEQNGRHERMHLTLKQETTRPAGSNMLQQQERFDRWVSEFNDERPHEALGMSRPGEIYTKSPRSPSAVPTPSYPLHDDVLRVRLSGHVKIGPCVVYVGSALGGEELGIRQIEPSKWLLTFTRFNLGIVDTLEKRFTANVRLVETGNGSSVT